MKWKELRNFLNSNFKDDQYISLMFDYIRGVVVITKDNNDSGLDHVFTFVSNTNDSDYDLEYNETTSSNFNNQNPTAVDYHYSEISRYFG